MFAGRSLARPALRATSPICVSAFKGLDKNRGGRVFSPLDCRSALRAAQGRPSGGDVGEADRGGPLPHYNPRMPRPSCSTDKIMQRATNLRNDPTEPEAKLWAYLRLKTNSRLAISEGSTPSAATSSTSAHPKRRLIIEVDGSQHIQQEKQDAERTAYLESQGYRVLRFWNTDIENDLEGVVKRIQDALAASEPRCRPLPAASRPPPPDGHTAPI